MSEPTPYVRRCPKCRHLNPESRNTCAQCDQYLGLEQAMPAPANPGAPHPAPGGAGGTAPEEASAAGTELPSGEEPGSSVVVTERADHRDPPPAMLILEVPGSGDTIAVRDGTTVGRAHPSNSADVQLEGLPDLNFVHRRHCRFELRDERWHCVALDEGSFIGPPNPTLVNGTPVLPCEARPIADGDRLTLAKTVLLVRTL